MHSSARFRIAVAIATLGLLGGLFPQMLVMHEDTTSNDQYQSLAVRHHPAVPGSGNWFFDDGSSGMVFASFAAWLWVAGLAILALWAVSENQSWAPAKLRGGTMVAGPMLVIAAMVLFEIGVEAHYADLSTRATGTMFAFTLAIGLLAILAWMWDLIPRRQTA